MITDFYEIPMGNLLVSDFLDKEKYMLHYENLQLYLILGLKLKKNNRILEFNQSQWLKPYVEFNTKKIMEAEKKVTKMEKRCSN